MIMQIEYMEPETANVTLQSMLDHFDKQHDRNSKYQHNIKPFFEISDHHRMMVMTGMSHGMRFIIHIAMHALMVIVHRFHFGSCMM